MKKSIILLAALLILTMVLLTGCNVASPTVKVSPSPTVGASPSPTIAASPSPTVEISPTEDIAGTEGPTVTPGEHESPAATAGE